MEKKVPSIIRRYSLNRLFGTHSAEEVWAAVQRIDPVLASKIYDCPHWDLISDYVSDADFLLIMGIAASLDPQSIEVLDQETMEFRRRYGSAF